MRGVDFGGEENGRNPSNDGVESKLRGPRNSSCTSDGVARWKCAGGLSCRTCVLPLEEEIQKAVINEGYEKYTSVPIHELSDHALLWLRIGVHTQIVRRTPRTWLIVNTSRGCDL